MKHASCRELYQYWNAIRGPDAAPPRTAIEPADIRTILCDMFILEVDQRRLYPFRLAGTRLCAAYGHELKATSFLGLWDEADRKQINLILSAVAFICQVASANAAGTIVKCISRTISLFIFH